MKAILLAAGRGTRIARNVEMVPKSTLPIDGEPLIRRSVALLQKAGMQCIVCTGYKEEKVKEEEKEEEKAKAAEEEKEKDSTIISYANKKVRVTLPKDLTSFHTPAREISRYSYMEESNVLGYSLYAKDRTFTIHFSIGTDGWDSAEAASISHNKVCKDESKMYEPCTVGEYSGYKYVVSSDKSIEYHYVLDYLVDGQDVVLTIREELRNDDDTSLLEQLLLDVVHNLKIELIGE